MRVSAIVPAAGKSTRIQSKTQKPYIKLCGKPILAHTLIALSENKDIVEIVLSVRSGFIERTRREVIDRYKLKKIKIVRGGKRRQDSVYNALKRVSADVDYVLIHDGARPFITKELISSSLKAAKRFGAGIVCVPVKPTLKSVDRKGFIKGTPDRRFFWEAQTPQTFKRDLIEKAYRKLEKRKLRVTDDSMLVERLGIKPKIVFGSYSNIKITTKEDLMLARLISGRKTTD